VGFFTSSTPIWLFSQSSSLLKLPICSRMLFFNY
jgi:hypothetical protein